MPTSPKPPGSPTDAANIPAAASSASPPKSKSPPPIPIQLKPDAQRYGLIGRVPLHGSERIIVPEGSTPKEAAEAYYTFLLAEEKRQAFEAKLAAAPLLSPEEAHGA